VGYFAVVMAGFIIRRALNAQDVGKESNRGTSTLINGLSDGELTLLFADIRHALRMMRRTPLFTAAVILTVMLAIGANTTIFRVVNAVLLRPLPFWEPGRLLQVAEKNDKLNRSVPQPPRP
jgi:hypothetical protein